MEMALMGRIERAAEQADAAMPASRWPFFGGGQGRT
jgi:hypothetical protein